CIGRHLKASIVVLNSGDFPPRDITRQWPRFFLDRCTSELFDLFFGASDRHLDFDARFDRKFHCGALHLHGSALHGRRSHAPAGLRKIAPQHLANALGVSAPDAEMATISLNGGINLAQAIAQVFVTFLLLTERWSDRHSIAVIAQAADDVFYHEADIRIDLIWALAVVVRECHSVCPSVVG